MTRTTFTHRTWLCIEWTCCTHIWQLLMSARFPNRWTWRPVCPKCGQRGD